MLFKIAFSQYHYLFYYVENQTMLQPYNIFVELNQNSDPTIGKTK